jgi:regulation of enolase protein 1 (concanavalin A-like superfamily)
MKHGRPARFGLGVERLESREMLSGSNAIDRLDFGNLASEAAHYFEPGATTSQLPLLGTGTVGASAGLTYRDPTDGMGMLFTLAVDPSKQNYCTIRLWGNDSDVNINLTSSTGQVLAYMEETGGPALFPGRFYYYTGTIPTSMTTGQTSVQLKLDIASPGKAVYSVFTHTDPVFTPDSADAAGTKPAQTGQATLDALTETEANNRLLALRQSIYNSGGYYDTVVARQVIVLNGNGTWSAPTGAPSEVIGLDLFSNLTSWMSSNPSATNDQWRNKIANTKSDGYSAFPGELLSVLTTTYLLDSLKNSQGTVIYSAPHYHDSTLVTRIVAAIDGVSYQQDSDGGIIQQGSEWTGLCSTARTTGSYIGSTARQTTYHGGGDLQGASTYALGWTLIQLLNDPTAAPILTSYLGQSYDADFSGTPMLRAYAWERLLDNMITFYQGATGGTQSQNMFQIPAMYSATIALNKLQALFPNSSYTTNYSLSLQYIKELMGLVPNTHMRGVGTDGSSPYTPSPYPNYGLTAKGFGEAHGSLSSGFDGGGYGQFLPFMATRVAVTTAWDTNIDTATRNAIVNMANVAIDSFDCFLAPLDDATVSNGVVTSNVFGFAEETWITYRDTKNPNLYANMFNFNPQYLASDPSGIVQNNDALRSAYLVAQYNLTPAYNVTGQGFGQEGGCLNYIRELPAYEATIKSLINVDPNTLTPLPAEPGQPDFVFTDVQAGAVAIVNHGERLYANLNYRNFENNNDTFTGLVPSKIARYHYTTDTIDRAGQVIMPYNSATVQSDGNLTSTALFGASILRLGDYLIVLNQGSTAFNAKLPIGVGLVQDLVTGNLYNLSSSTSQTTVSVAAGSSAVFWLAASKVYGPLGTSSSGSDIGAVGMSGSNSYAGSVYTLSGAGADIGGTSDAFRFVSASAAGDVTISAQITSQTNTGASAKAGVMIRDGSAANAAYAAVLRTPGNGLMFQWRSAAGGSTSWAAAPTPLSNAWVRLARSGDNFSASYSIDGLSWTQIGSTKTISLSTTVNVGLAVCSHTTSALSTVAFANVSLNAGVAPSVATAATATLVTTGGNAYKQANLSVLGADDGGESGLTYTWYVVGAPPSPVTFSLNGNNAAKNTVATFASAGVYSLRVIIRDSGGATATNDLGVTVSQVLSGLTVWPNSGPVYVGGGQTQSFVAVPNDQFGKILGGPASSVTWSIDSGGVGSIDSNGLYTAPASGAGSATVRATSGSISKTTAVTCIGIFTNSQDIGSPALAGSASYNSTSGTYTVLGGGVDIWTGDDQFRYVYLPVTGDATIIARVSSSTSDTTYGWNKCGVMFRSSLNAQSAYAMMCVTGSKGFDFQWRTSDTSGLAQSYTGSGGQVGWVKLVRAGNTFTAYYSSSTSTTQPTTWSQTATSSQTITMNSTVYVGLEVCSHNSSALNTTGFSGVTLTNTPAAPTFPYRVDIGSPSPAGTYTESSGAVTMTAGGADIWGTSDQFQFAYVPITGNATLTARVVSLANTNINAKAGVMIRNTLDANSANVATLVTAANGINLAYRSSAGGSSSETKITGLAAPYWVRIVRSDSSFSSYRSSDGTTWTQIGTTRTISMNSTVYVGLALTSHANGTATTAVFDNISLSGTADAAPTVANPASASANPVNGTTVNLGVLGTDTDGGGESNLSYTWTQDRTAPPANVSFSANGTNAAKNTTVTFTKTGLYNFRVTVKDAGGLSVDSSVSVTVDQTLTSIAISPATTNLSPLGTQQFVAVAKDQFGSPMTAQPSFTWSVVGGSGSIDSHGLYTATAAGTSAAVRATAGIYGSATVSIVNQKPLLAASIYPNALENPLLGNTTSLSALAVDDAGEANLLYTWSVVSKPSGAADPIFTANGTNSAKNTFARFTQSGPYTIKVAVTDQSGLSSENNLTVNVTFAPETYTWDGGSTVNSNWSTAENWGDDLAPLAGDNLVFPDGAARLQNVNDYPAGTAFGSVIISGTGYNITNGSNRSTTSIQVQPNMQVVADQIITGTLTLGAGSVLTITAIAGGPSASNSLIPLGTQALSRAATETVLRPTVAESVTEPLWATELLVNEGTVPAAPLDSSSTTRISTVTMPTALVARMATPVRLSEPVTPMSRIEVAANPFNPLPLPTPICHRLYSMASGGAIENCLWIPAVGRRLDEIGTTVLTSSRDEMPLNTEIIQRRLYSPAVTRLSHSVALQALVQESDWNDAHSEAELDVSRNVRTGKHIRQFETLLDKVLAEDEQTSLCGQAF